MKRVAKFVTALIGAGLLVLSSALTDGDFSLVEQMQVAIAVVAAGGVWVAANVPAMTWAKTAIAALLAALSLAVVYLTDHAGVSLTGSEWANVGLAVLIALGVYAIPNAAQGG